MNNKWQQETVNTERFNKTDLLRDRKMFDSETITRYSVELYEGKES